MASNSITLKVKGHDHLKYKFQQYGRRIESGSKQSLSQVAKLLKTDVIKQIKKQVGTRGIRYNPKRSVVVSREGEYPNDDLGGLVRGIRAYVKKTGRNRYTVMFESRAPYALDLEMGTVKMPKGRPYMKPTLAKNRKKIAAIMRRGAKVA